MKVQVIKNKISDLPDRLQQYAYGQDQNGELDIKQGQDYDLKGVRYLGSDIFYLVNNPDYLWWMPAIFYEPSLHEIEQHIPQSWKRIEYGENSSLEERDTIIAPAIYHDNIFEVEDRTEKGMQVMREMTLET